MNSKIIPSKAKIVVSIIVSFLMFLPVELFTLQHIIPDSSDFLWIRVPVIVLGILMAIVTIILPIYIMVEWEDEKCDEFLENISYSKILKTGKVWKQKQSH